MTEKSVYNPDRYGRLTDSARILAEGTDFGDGFMTAEILVAFTEHLAMLRVLDGLTEHDADTVSLLVLLDIIKGVPRMAWRLTDWTAEDRSVDREDDNQAVVSVLARVLSVWTAAICGEEFEIAQQIISAVP